MNKTKAIADQTAAKYDQCSAFQVALFGPDSGQMIAGSEKTIAKNLTSNDGTGTVVSLPEDFFELEIPAGSYRLGVRGINPGGPGTYALSEQFDVTPEPLPLANVRVE
jgi:hypothetical protein